MIDSFEMVRPQVEACGHHDVIGVGKKTYGVVTLHRPSNVDDPAQLARLVEALLAIQARLPLIFSVHPRTVPRLAQAGLLDRLKQAGVRRLEPVSYIRFMNLVMNAAAVITDSGGIQEETTYLGIPCFTLRENTERPITISEGTNRLVVAATLGRHFDDRHGAEVGKGG